jgi:hypothetical protein
MNQDVIINDVDGALTEENQAQATAPVMNIALNEVAAGALTKTVDTAVALSQFAVNTTIGIGQITLGSISGLFNSGTEALNTQFGNMVNRIFGVRS